MGYEYLYRTPRNNGVYVIKIRHPPPPQSTHTYTHAVQVHMSVEQHDDKPSDAYHSDIRFGAFTMTGESDTMQN